MWTAREFGLVSGISILDNEFAIIINIITFQSPLKHLDRSGTKQDIMST